jgi:hypothetical protein
MQKNGLRRLVSIIGLLALAGTGRAGEGMWPVNAPPIEEIERQTGVRLDPAVLARWQLGAVSMGASGSFVSSRGLLMTNHHVASGALAKLSTPQRNLLQSGYVARTTADELPLPDTRVSVLLSIRDVTAQVREAIDGVPADAEDRVAKQGAAQRRASAKLEADASDRQAGTRARVVTLYGGAQHHLYTFKDYTDVRLVFAPESAIASFGADADNFEFPRFALDAAFYRVYENGQPVTPAVHFPFAQQPLREGDAVFVLGHPGRTQRQLTLSDLEFRRDIDLPLSLQSLWRWEVLLQTFARRGPAQAAIAEDDLGGVENSRKALMGQLAALHDPAVWRAKLKAEDQLQRAVLGNPQWAQQWGTAWQSVARLSAERRAWHLRWTLLRRGLRSDGATYAQQIARLGAQLGRPSAERYPEYRDAELAGVKRRLGADVPLDQEYEAFVLAGYLSELAERLGADDPLVKAALAGQSPVERAHAVIRGTFLLDGARRRELLEAGPEAINASNDPALQLARAIEPFYADVRRLNDEWLEPQEREAYRLIADARAQVLGTSTYPDATGTLRLSFGVVKGHEQSGATVAPFTDIAGLFARADARGGPQGSRDFDLPKVWADARARLNPQTPVNFIADADIIGGNSGSPALNARGEVVGLIFDGNAHSLAGAFHYDGARNRAVSVDARFIIEALRTVYGAGALADELTVRSPAP